MVIDISSFTGKARSTIANALRILNLPQEVLDLISAGKIDRGHAKVLLSLKNTKDIINQAKTISTQGISVSALSSSMRKKTKKPNTDPDIQSLIEELSNSFGHKVSISQKSKNKQNTNYRNFLMIFFFARESIPRVPGTLGDQK